MIIGEKIKNTVKRNEEKYQLNHIELANLMQRDDDNLPFYM